MFANVWMGVRVEAHDVIIERLRWDEESQGEYSGPVTDRERKFFRRMIHRANVQRMFKKSIIGGKEWTLWNLVLTEKLSKVKIELDQLLADRPNHISIAGAWQRDGRQFGTQFVYDADGQEVGVTGTPTFPIPVNALMKFIPDIVERDEDGNVISTTPATVLTDVNRLQGQAPRRFN